MKGQKKTAMVFLIINILALIFLCYIAYPYIIHDTTVENPDAMIPAENWDWSGFRVLLSFFPILLVDAISFIVGKGLTEKVAPRLLNFVPSALALIISVSYIAASF